MKKVGSQVIKRNKGITLIALVITIIVLLILAGVTIATLTGDNGILTKASQAGEQTQIGEEKEAIIMAYNGVMTENEGKEVSAIELQEELKTNGYHTIIADNGDGTLTAIFETGREYIINSDGRIERIDSIPIPKGFYHVAGTTVTKGLVISDVEGDDLNNTKGGNQYVWIPVQGILGENGKTVQNAVDGEIILGRYTFDTNGNIDTNGSPTTLGGTLKTTDSSFTYTENSTGTGNTVAKDIEGFIKSVRENGGYYIARFEASQGSNNKAESKYNKTVWNNITQPNAAIACQDLYSGVNSDLINSYAWDTAILFIQKYSGDEDYSRQFRLQATMAKTGKATDGTNYDVRCNIYDMAGNCCEWSTETSSNGLGHCVPRGIAYTVTTNGGSSHRGTGNDTGTRMTVYSFRSILYL